MNPLLRTNRQLLAILKERLGNLQKFEEFSVDFKKIPSEGQSYFYRSVANLGPSEQAVPGTTITSFVRVEQDAAFVVTDIYVTGAYDRKPFVPGTSAVYTPLVKFTNFSNGRNLTISSDSVIYSDPTVPVTFTEFGIPQPALQPLGSFPGAIISYDYHYKMPCEYLVPRASVIGGAFQFNDSSEPSYSYALDFVLGGYKVFGA